MAPLGNFGLLRNLLEEALPVFGQRLQQAKMVGLTSLFGLKGPDNSLKVLGVALLDLLVSRLDFGEMGWYARRDEIGAELEKALQNQTEDHERRPLTKAGCDQFRPPGHRIRRVAVGHLRLPRKESI